MTITSVKCNSAREASGVLASNPRARLLGGGTLVMRSVNEGDQSFDTIVRLVDPALQQIQLTTDRLLLGAAITMSAVSVHRDCEFLAAAARSVGGPAIRNMATVGGNLFAPCPYGDFTTALLALDAEVNFADGAAVSLTEFLATRDTVGVRVVTGVTVQRPASVGDFRFLKVSRVKPKGISVMAIAAWLPRNGHTLSNVRIAIGSMAPTSVRMHKVEAALEGRALDNSSIESAVQVATEGLNPPTDPIASSWYRTAVVPVHLRRLLQGPDSRGKIQ